MRKYTYDYLIVGSGLFGSTFAQIMNGNGKKCLVIDKRGHTGGNIYTKEENDIKIHWYGAHIFHTDNEEVWHYINKFTKFNNYINSPLAYSEGKLYNLPFNMNTFNKLWNVNTPEEAKHKIQEQCSKYKDISQPANLEEQALKLCGDDIYYTFIKEYTEKQWGRDCKDLPSFIIKRLPVRFTYDNNYFNALYQGVPIGGYTEMVNKMLDGIEVNLNVDYLEDRDLWNNIAQTVVYTGPIDAFYKYCFGALQYRSVRFETELLDIPNYQGNAAVNYTDSETPWTRIIEHKWFEFGKNEKGEDIPRTVISRELSSEWKLGDEPYYPVNDDFNNSLYFKYKELSDKERNIIFGGRLAEYKYYDMDAVIAAALDMCEKEL